MDELISRFKSLYPVFAEYEEDMLVEIYNQAILLISIRCIELSDLVTMALMAHILEKYETVSQGTLSTVKIDDVTLGFLGQSGNDAWQNWLNSTAYGQMVLALVAACSSGTGMYVGGNADRFSLRSYPGRGL